jgi:hypothetical protein
MKTIVQLRDDVQNAFDTVLKCADCAERRTFSDVEAELGTGIPGEV